MMATINPFYRFEDAIQVGSLGQRGYIISIALNEIFTAINVSQAGQTLAQVLATCNGLATQYNDDLNANYVVDCFYNTDPAIPYPVQIFIYDSVVAVQYPLLKISLVLIIDPITNQVTLSNAWFMGLLSPNYNYSDVLCADELEAYKALTQYAETGSAIFPKTYKFDPNTGIASSSMARLKPCRFNVVTGQAERFPIDAYARGARPSIEPLTLSSAGSYIVKLFNSLLALAETPGTTIVDIHGASQSWALPDGFYLSTSLITSGFARTQINVYSATEGFAIVAREDNGFEFQRFFAPQYLPFNFLANFADTLSLPYEGYGDSYKYGDSFYDFDFCEFNNCAYPAKESYPMPSKSGDEYQFNVQRYKSNVLPYDNVSIGLFDKNFNLVQKIGEASKFETIQCDCTSVCTLTLTYEISEEDWEAYLAELNQFSEEPITTCSFKVVRVGGGVIGSETIIQGQSEGLFNTSTIVDGLEGSDFVFTTDGVYRWTYTLPNATCGEEYYMINTIQAFGLPPNPPPVNIWTTENFQCPSEFPVEIEPNQLNANALIPMVKSDCYRFGLYRFENNSFGATIDFETTSIFPVSNSQFHVLIIADEPPITSIKYMIVLPFYVVTFSDFVNYINSIFPDSITQNPSDPNPFFQLCGYNTQFTSNDYFFFGTYDFGTDTFVDFNFGEISNISCSDAEENISEIYSFSNLISIDNSDCFSTMIQFWAESNAIAQGFEYYNDWFQQVRLGINGGGMKPILTESTYRQSNGVTRRPQNKQDLSIDLHTDFLDFETQSALVDATRHTNFVVDGRNLFVNGDIDVATIQDFTTQSSFEDLAQVKFSALIQGFQPKNSTCVNC